MQSSEVNQPAEVPPAPGGGGDHIRRLVPFVLLGIIAVAILRFAATESGLLGEEAAVTIAVLLILALVAGVLIHVAREADAAEAERRRIEAANAEAAPALAQRARELEQANAELAEATARLERSNEELQRFATVASHDLREPLRVVSGFAELLARRYGDQLEGDGRRFVDAITTGVERMDAMIADLLAYARAGRADQPLEQVDCNDVVADALAALDVAVGESGAHVEVEPLPVVTGNPAALGQLFQNLIANAIKFVDAGPPRIRIWAAEVPGAWRFSVRDNGIGVDPEQADKIFGMFTRAHGRDRYPGTGVGLALCQRIVDVHGGRIWVEPAPGGGSQFMFTIHDHRATG